MVRFRKCRILILNAAKIPLIEKLSLILPFIVIVIDLIVLEHAIRINEHYIILCASILFSLSVVEISVAMKEILDHKKK
ncbi:MAG TPA: hypothetical protein VMY59_04185 [Candidatus Thermoplasmatota archaeon]|nr:hypothetical protein [Candidatus Thermoplasmatota archaeon]